MTKNTVDHQELLSMLSHDVKNPLTVIKAYSQLLYPHLKDKEKTYVKKILYQVEEATLIINTFSLYRKIVGGKLTFDNSAVKIDELINESIRSFQQTHEEEIIKDGDITLSLDSDKELLKYVLTFVLHQMSKRSTSKIITLAVEKKNNEFIISFINNGKHIEKDILDNIFIINKSDKKQELGWYVCNEVLKLLNCKFILESPKGKGLNVFIKLPEKL